MGLYLNLLLAFWFAKVGSKRVMGGFTSFFWGLFSPLVGIFFVFNSRRLDDQLRNQELIEKYKPHSNTDVKD